MGEPLEHVISFASGKGGVGKTLSVIHMAIAAARKGKKVLLIDGDLGMANIDVLLGLNVSGTLEDFFSNGRNLRDILVKGPFGIELLPSGSGIASIANLNLAKRLMLLDEIQELTKTYDYVLIDTGAGISNAVLQLNSCSHDIVVVSNPEPHALTDAYAFIKVMNQVYGKNKFNIIINKAINEDHGLKIFNRFAEICQRNIRVKINCLSVVPNDELIQQQISDSSWGFESSRHSRAGYAWEQAFSLFDRQRSLGYDTGKEQVWDNLIYSNNHELKVDP